MSLVLVVCLPFGLAVVAVLVAAIVDSIHNVRESRRSTPVLRETVPIRPWPYDAPRLNDRAPVASRARSEQGAIDGGFLRRLALVCLIVFMTVGGCVYLVDQVVPDRAAQVRSDPVDGTEPAKPSAPQGMPRGGERCGSGA